LDILVASCVAYVCGGLCEGHAHGGASRGNRSEAHYGSVMVSEGLRGTSGTSRRRDVLKLTIGG
jgi:hypothetical protein